MIIVASDGLWDAIDAQGACELAAEYIGDLPDAASVQNAAEALACVCAGLLNAGATSLQHTTTTRHLDILVALHRQQHSLLLQCAAVLHT